MSVNLKGKSLLTLADYDPAEIRYLLDLSSEVKRDRAAGHLRSRFTGRTLALLFEKRSTRTRCAFETAFGEEGGHPVFLSPADIHLGAKETVDDTARALGRMFDCIQYRGYAHKTAEILAEYSGVPVYNGLTDDYHPTQALADILTVEEVCGDARGRIICYIGDGRNNVANSLLIIASKIGAHVSIVAPPSLQPESNIVEMATEYASTSGARITVTDNIAAGIEKADILYTDVWVSMGEEEKEAERVTLLEPYRVNSELLSATGNPDCRFMHCLPAVKGNEVTEEVIDGPASVVWDQAENRKHTIKALLLSTLGLD